jgi:adenylate cyclase
LPSIAVLPFVNLSEDQKGQLLCDGITDNIINVLSKVPRLFVIARNSTFTYKGKPVKVKQVSEELGVRYVLEGSIQVSGDRIRTTVQLIDALTGNQIWAERYDGASTDIFDLQDDITTKVLSAVQVKLEGGSSPESI